jgi:hypothetical protein
MSELNIKKVECYCYVFDRITIGEVIEETKIERSNLIYADVKCECGNIHSVVSNIKGLV